MSHYLYSMLFGGGQQGAAQSGGAHSRRGRGTGGVTATSTTCPATRCRQALVDGARVAKALKSAGGVAPRAALEWFEDESDVELSALFE